MKNNSSQTEIKRYPKRIITSFQLGNLVGLMIPWCFIVIFIFVAPSVEEIGHFGVFLWLLLIFSAVVDNATIITKIRSEGLYNGINLFFSRINIAVQAIVFWIMMVQQASLN